MVDEELHKELRKSTWEDYSVEIVKDYQEILQKIVPKYALVKKSMDLEELEQAAEEEEAEDV